MGKNIVLIGMPGVGKSTIGVILAKEIGYQFLDADLLIQEQEGMLLKDIIATKGHDGFLAVENQVNRDVDAKHSEKYADIIIDEDNKGIEETLELLKEKFC